MTRWVWTTFENKHLMMGDLIYAYCIAADCMLLVGAVRPKQVVQVIVIASRPPHYCRKKRKSNPGSISHPGKEGQTSDHYQKYRHSDYAPPTPPISKVTDTDRTTPFFAIGVISLRCKSFQPIEAFEMMRDAKQPPCFKRFATHPGTRIGQPPRASPSDKSRCPS